MKAVKSQQNQKIASIQGQTNRIESRVDGIKYDDAGFGGQMKQLREQLNADFHKVLQKVQGERQMNVAALENKIRCTALRRGQ